MTLFNCNLCNQRSFATERALKIHNSRSHNQKANLKCTICGKVFAREIHLEKHYKNTSCNASLIQQIQIQATQQANQQVQTVTEAVQLVMKHIGPTTINNINNITNNNVYNNNRSYTQQNNFLSDNFEKLVPITEKSLKENFKQVFNEARLKNHYFTSEKDIGFKLTTGPLKESLICTDASRGIVHWKDGDNDNKHVKDPQCLSLSNKMFNVIANNLDVVDDYKNFLNEKQDSFNINTTQEEALSCCDSSVILNQLTKSDTSDTTITKIAKAMSKSVPSDLTFVKKEYKLEKLCSLIEKIVYENPHEVLLQSASGIASWFLKTLGTYGFTKNKNSDNLVTIIDDEGKILPLSKKDVFNILRHAFEKIERYDIIAKVSLTSYYNTFVDKVESFEDAQVNFKNFDLWIKEENVEAFERSFYHFFCILLR